MTTQNTELAQREQTHLAETVDNSAVRIAPPVDIYENNDEILVLADFPAVASDGVTVRLEGSELLIEGTQTGADRSDGERPPVLSRTFRVPTSVDPNGITAELNQGVLRVHLAKSEAAKPRRIEVRAS